MKKSAPYSLRQQLLIWITVPVLVAGFLTALLAFAFSWYEIEEVYDAQLVHSAKVMLQLAEHEIVNNEGVSINLGVENPNLSHRYEKKMAFRLWYKDALVTQSANAEIFADFEAPPGFSDQTIEGKPWRFFVFVDPAKDLRVETSERYAIRYELIGQLMISLIAPALLFIPAIILAVWFGVRRSLRPVLALSRSVDARHSTDLTPVDSNDSPAEVVPLVQALNRLFSRLHESFKREREFTDHAAHELRTPLAAMKTQTQVLMKKTSAQPEWRDGLDNLHASIMRATHLIEQLLSLARLQNESLALTEADMAACVREALESISMAVKDKGMVLNLSLVDHAPIQGHAGSLVMMVRNLLDNAIKYAPPGSAVAVTLTPNNLTISDYGPGLSDTDKARVFERFVRVDRSGQTGSGLGLSIAKWVAEMHGVDITLSDNQPQGLTVNLRWTHGDIA
jgi:signal transduction histidine kinase